MFDKNKVQESLNRVDNLLSRAKIIEPVLSRLDHITLVNDLRLINECCMEYFDERAEKQPRIVEFKNGGTDINAEYTVTDDADCKGCGDSVQGG